MPNRKAEVYPPQAGSKAEGRGRGSLTAEDAEGAEEKRRVKKDRGKDGGNLRLFLGSFLSHAEAAVDDEDLAGDVVGEG
jgi:hypothetical protein